MTTPSFSSLTKYMLLEFLKDWLILEEICSLDTGLCNHASRGKFIEILSSKTVKFKVREVQFISEACIKYMQFRNIDIREIYIHYGVIPESFKSVDFSKIKLLSLKKLNDTENIASLCVALSQSVELTELSIVESQIVTNDFLIGVSDNCHNITKLTLSHLKEVTSEAIFRLSEHLTQLQHLTNNNCSRVSQDALSFLVIANQSSLTHVDLSNSDVTFQVMTALAQCTKLTALHVKFSTSAYSNGLDLLLEQNPNITELSFGGRLNPGTDSFLIDVATRHLTKLRSVTLPADKITNFGVSVFLSKCKQITDLNISIKTVSSIEHAVLTAAVELDHLHKLTFQHKKGLNLMRVLRPKFDQITTLDLSVCRIEGTPRRKRATDRQLTVESLQLQLGMINVEDTFASSSCSELQRFSPNEQITAQQMVEIVSVCGRTLTSLDMHMRALIATDAEVRMIAAQCAFLRSVDLGYCSKLTDSGVISLIDANRNLTELSLEGCCEGITERTVKHIAMHCNRLQIFNISFCDRLVGVESLVCVLLRHNKHMTCLRLPGVNLSVNSSRRGMSDICETALQHCKFLHDLWCGTKRMVIRDEAEALKIEVVVPSVLLKNKRKL